MLRDSRSQRIMVPGFDSFTWCTLGSLAELVSLFVIVFTLNIIPAFAPPTWLALSWVGFDHPQVNPFVVALIAALAATSGRILLARFSRMIIRQRFMSDAMRGNIDVIKDKLEGHATATFGTFLVFAFSPFPSNYLFIAYGLTTLPLRLVAVPFFIGRFFSYSFFVAGASTVSRHVAFENADAKHYFGIYFVVTQLLFLGLVIVLARIDWKHLLATKQFRWLRPASNNDKPI